MTEGYGDQAAGTVTRGKGQRGLQEALGAHEVGLEAWAEGIAPPSNAGSVQAGATQQGIVQAGAHGSVGRQGLDDGAAHHGEERGGGKTRVGKEPVTGGPVTKRRRKWLTDRSR